MAVLAVYENHLVNDAGTPIVGATVNAYRVDTGALAATTTTQGATAGPPPKRAGRWVIGPLEDTLEYYIEAVVGSEKVVMGRWSGEMGTLKVFDRAILPANTTINGATPVTSANIAGQTVANSLALGGVAAANYSQTSHNHNATYSLLGHTHSYSNIGHTHSYSDLGHNHNAEALIPATVAASQVTTSGFVFADGGLRVTSALRIHNNIRSVAAQGGPTNGRIAVQDESGGHIGYLYLYN